MSAHLRVQRMAAETQPSAPPPRRLFVGTGLLIVATCLLCIFINNASKSLSRASGTVFRSASELAVRIASGPPLPPVVSAQDAASAIVDIVGMLDMEEPMRVAREAWETWRVYPISFSRSQSQWMEPAPSPEDAIRAAAVESLVASKPRDWALIVPGNLRTYVYTNEMDYLHGYVESWKAHTWAKFGVDCNRHLEIMASGTLPMFRGLEAVPRATLFAYPKRLMAHMYAHSSESDVRRLALWRHFILTWGRRFLTAPAMARYMSEAAGVDLGASSNGTDVLANASLGRAGRTSRLPRVAFIDNALPRSMDYLSNFVLIGLVELLGSDRVDVFYPPRYAYDGGPDVSEDGRTLYGRGYGVAHVLRPPRTTEQLATTFDVMLGRLHRAEYAAVVWGSFTRSTAHFADVALPAYAGQPQRLWLCDGEDTYTGWAKGGTYRHDATVFVRELV